MYLLFLAENLQAKSFIWKQMQRLCLSLLVCERGNVLGSVVRRKSFFAYSMVSRVSTYAWFVLKLSHCYNTRTHGTSSLVARQRTYGLSARRAGSVSLWTLPTLASMASACLPFVSLTVAELNKTIGVILIGGILAAVWGFHLYSSSSMPDCRRHGRSLYGVTNVQTFVFYSQYYTEICFLKSLVIFVSFHAFSIGAESYGWMCCLRLASYGNHKKISDRSYERPLMM